MLTPVTTYRSDLHDLNERAWAEIDDWGTTVQKLRSCFSQWFGAARLGDRAGFDEALARFSDRQPEAMSPAIESMLLMQEILCGQLFGTLDAADAAAARLVEVSTAQDDDSAQNYQALAGFMTARERGLMPELQPVLEELHSDISAGPTAALRASGLALAGATDLALAELEAGRPFDDVADDPGYPVTVSGYAEAAAVLNHAEAAREIYPLIEILGAGGGQFVVTGCYASGAVASWLARLDATMGNHAEAEANFRRGIEVCDAFGATAHGARGRIDYAELCLAQGRPDDARRLAQEALDLVEGTELADSRNRATALLAQLG
jgi:tetratricopeptide (TPR) repeat protein